MEGLYGDAYRSWWALPDRLKDMDKEGIDIAIGFPTNGQLLGDIVWAKTPDLHEALVTAYNNWVIDYCKDSRGRMKAIGHATPMNAEAGVQEIYRVAKTDSVVGVFHPTMEIDNSWGDTRYEPL